MTDFLAGSTALLYPAVIIFGLLIGSFLNVVILRLPKRMMYEWQQQSREFLEENPDPIAYPPGLVWPRSRCTQCKHTITALENIPVVSYLFLRGRCSSCKQKISFRYPVFELLTAAASVAVIWKFGFTPEAAWGLLLTWCLIALSGIDIDHQILPDNITLPLIWLGLFASTFGVFTDPVSSIIGGLAGYLTLWLVYQAFRLLTGKEGMGFGDFKLFAALGTWLGWQQLPLIILLSSLIGAVAGLLMILFTKHDKRKPIPFGPYLAMAGWVALIWGDSLRAWYFQISGL